MTQLQAEFSREDLETLIEAMGEWEIVANEEYHALNMVKNIPMPDQDSEFFEYISKLKEQFSKREKDIRASREVRQEKAVFLKAKLMLVRRELGINQLFDMAGSTSPTVETPVASKPVSVENNPEAQTALELAEYFIKDLGTWDFYQKFLKEKREEEQSA